MRSLTPFLLLAVLCAPAARAAADELPPFDIDVLSPVVTLPFRATDADFSAARNVIVAVSTSPNQLHVYDPEANTTTSVSLMSPPRCLSVSPDGQFAVVGHDTTITHVDLATATVIQSIAMSAPASEIVYGGNGYAYVFTPFGLYAVQLTTKAQTLFSYNSRRPANARLHPFGTKIYGADRNTSPDDIVRFNIENGPASSSYDSPYHGDYSMCSDLWVSMDGLRLFTACGHVFRASDYYAQDMRYAGKLSQEVRIQWAAHSQPGNNIGVLPFYQGSQSSPRRDHQIHYYTHDFLLYRGKADLPSVPFNSTNVQTRGRWVFFNAAGTKQYVVVQTDTTPGLTNDYGVVTIDCSNATVSVNPTSQSVAQGGATVQTPVTGSAGCGWKATSNASWISTFSSGVGDGTLSFTVSPNTTGRSRIGTISIGTATLAVTQPGLHPVGLVATAMSPTAVSLTWSAPGSPDHFEVWRTSGGAFALVGTPAAGSFTDTVSADTAYVYKVRSVTGIGELSDFGVPDYTHTYAFTDPIVTTGTTLKAAHVTELRTAVNAIRSAAGLSTATFTDAALTGTIAKVVHVTELRDSLAAIRSALGKPPAAFTALTSGSIVRAAETEELRTGAK